MKIDQIKKILSHITSDKKLTVLEELLINAVESLLQIIQDIQKDNQDLKDENRRLQNEQGKPKIRGNSKRKPVSDFSSEKERKIAKKHTKSVKKDKITIHRRETREVDPSILPADAEFKGYDKVVIQNLKIQPDNICFELEMWYSPSEQKTYRATVDPEYSGSEFSPDLQAFIIDLSIQGRMSEYQICNFLKDKGIIISEGTISNILIQNNEAFHQEMDNAFQAGLRSTAYHQVDDTGARHNGRNGYTMIVGNPFYTRYFTSFSKDRFQVLLNLLGGGHLKYSFSELTTALLEKEKIAHWTLNVVKELEGRTIWSLAELENIFKEKLWGELPPKKQWESILYVSAVTAYFQQTDYHPVLILICDDAGQFKIPTVLIQLCWVHIGRNFKKLSPYSPRYQEILAQFLNDFWEYYHRLKAFKKKPSEKLKQELSRDFDELFSRKTGFKELDDLLEIKRTKKSQLLLVLDYPEIPIHNNHSEQQIRVMVMKRKVSSGTKSDSGRKSRDTWMGLMMTCKKLGIGFFDYLKDRLRRDGNIPSLDEIIEQKARIHNKGNDNSKSTAD